MRTYRIAVFAVGSAAVLIAFVSSNGPKRVAVVEPGRIFRGAWQSPGTLNSLIRKESIRTVVTLTAINRDDPKYVSQLEATRKAGVDWRIIPMRGSTATVEQMAEAADMIADPSLQPVFFHCVGGHHRSNLVHAAYLIRHKQYSAEAAWSKVASLPWSRPTADADIRDHARIVEFAALEASRSRSKDIR